MGSSMSIDGPTEDRQGLFDRRRSSWFLGPASAAVALHFVGCLGEPYAPPTSCGNGADANKNYTANIEEAYDARVTDVKFDPVFAEIEPSCAGFDSLDVGSTITFAITSMVENVGCTVHRADATLPTSVNETGDATHLGGSYAATFALFHRSVSVRSCTGVVEVKFKAPSGRPSMRRAQVSRRPSSSTGHSRRLRLRSAPRSAGPPEHLSAKTHGQRRLFSSERTRDAAAYVPSRDSGGRRLV